MNLRRRGIPGIVRAFPKISKNRRVFPEAVANRLATAVEGYVMKKTHIFALAGLCLFGTMPPGFCAAEAVYRTGVAPAPDGL